MYSVARFNSSTGSYESVSNHKTKQQALAKLGSRITGAASRGEGGRWTLLKDERKIIPTILIDSRNS